MAHNYGRPYDAITEILGSSNPYLNLSVFNPNRADGSSEFMTQIWIGSPGKWMNLHSMKFFL